MNNTYRFLFPYEKVKPNTNIIIYGAGIVGIEYLKQMLITHYSNVIGLIDRNYKEYLSMVVPVYSPDNIPNLKFDYVVIALKSAIYVDEIKNELLKQGVNTKKIICSFERDDNVSVFERDIEKRQFLKFAYKYTKKSIAILVSGGIGDMVIHKRFITEITKIAPECMIDIYCSGMGNFLKYLYIDSKNINEIISDLGSQFMEHYMQYALAIEIASTRYIHVTRFEKELFKHNNNLKERIVQLDKESQKEDFNFNTLLYSIYQRRLYNGYNAYSALGYNGAFEIFDKKVNIPLIKESEEVFHSLGLSKYITINYGNITSREENKVAKMWPYHYFVQLVAMFKEKYSDIDIVQVGGDSSIEIEGVSKVLLGKDFGLVTYILKNALFHLDIEGGLVHIASQLGTKCIVLFGPTSKEYFGYENNINLSAGICHDCCGLYKDLYACARSMDKPECMYAITPELVLDNINAYMNELNEEDYSDS